LPCFKLKAAASQQLMGQLPFARITVARPFVITGIDYGGAFEIKSGNARSKTTTSYYVTLFICMATKAIHFELVPYLISEEFTAALKRRIARRELIGHMCSDNGSNFARGSGDSKALFKCAELLRQANDYSKDTISVSFYSSDLTPFWRSVGNKRQVLKVSLE
jgi:hypothetical protein